MNTEGPGLLAQAMLVVDQAEADAHFERLVQHCMARCPELSRGDAELIERCWIASFAATYRDADTQARMRRLYGIEACHNISPRLAGRW